MLLKDILNGKGHDVYAIVSTASCYEAVAEMVRCRVGALLVRDGAQGPLLGIITERDILHALAEHRGAFESLPIAAIMSEDPVVAQPDDHVMVAMRLMTTRRIRHLPVVLDDEVQGVVSIGDIVKSHHDELEFENHYMRTYIHGDAVGSGRTMNEDVPTNAREGR